MASEAQDVPGEAAADAPTETAAKDTNAPEGESAPQEPESETTKEEPAAGDSEAQEAEPAKEEPPKENTDKLKAIADLKAAIMAAAAKPKQKKAETEELIALCQCVKKLASDSEIMREFEKIMPKIGEEHFVELMGIKRPAPQSKVLPGKPAGLTGLQRVTGRVKSYNTRKGFGFLTVPSFGRDIFVYNAHLVGRIGLVAGETVQFDLLIDNGRPQARNVKAQASAPPEFVPGSQMPINAAANPFASLKQAMNQNQPAPQQNDAASMRDLALAMAAAAAEVPTTLPATAKSGITPSQEEQLYDKIREAQSKAAEERTPAPNANGADPSQVLKGMLGNAPVSLANYSKDGSDSSAQVNDGRIRPGDRVKVIEFPAPDVNGCIGTVRGYDAASGRYLVDVEMRTGEVVPMSLREEYMQKPGQKKPALGEKGSMPPALPGGGAGSALRKSAADALKHFAQLAPPQQQQQGMGNNWQFGAGGGGPGGMPGGGAGGAQGGMGYPQKGGNHFGLQQAAQQAQQAMQAMKGGPGAGGPPGSGKGGPMQMGGMQPMGQSMGKGRDPGSQGMQGGMPQGPQAQAMGKGAMPNRGPPGPGPGPSGPSGPGGMPPQNPAAGMPKMHPPQPPAQGGGMSLDRSAMQGSIAGQQQRQAKMMQEQAQAQAAQMQQLQHQQLQQLQQLQKQPGAPPQQQQMPLNLLPQPPPLPQAAKPSGPPQPIASSKPEGKPGQVWVVLHSPHFPDVIVRATHQVTSKEMRRILPGEVCTQRDMTLVLENGLVRMPVEPDGWVTVHARNINGPTFLAETDSALGRPAAGRPGPPRREGTGMPPAPPPPQAREKAPVDYVRQTYTRDEFLNVRQKLLAKPGSKIYQVPEDIGDMRMLRVPNMKAAPPRDRGDREERREQRRKERDTKDEDIAPAPKEPAPAPKVPAPPAEGGGEEKKAANGEEKKANCPTQ